MKDVTRNEAGEIIRFVTRRMGVSVARPQYGSPDGVRRYSKVFYYAKMIAGELARFPLSPNASDAEKLADQIAGFLSQPQNSLDAARRQFNPRAVARGSNYSTIGEVLEYHRENWRMLEISNNSGEDYHHSLILILRQADAYRKGTEFVSWSGMRTGKAERMAPWLEKPTTLLTEQLAIDYQRLMVTADLEDEEEIITAKISSDSNLRNARAVFSKEAMRLFRSSRTITLPDLGGFMSVSLFHAKKYFVLPDPAVIRMLFTNAPALRAEDLNAYRAFLVCVQAGLRKTEAANLRMEWMRNEDSPALLIHQDGTFKPKHGHGRKVFLDGWVAEEMRSLAGERKYFIDGTDTERTDEVFIRLNGWLRKQGINATKPTHELRKLWFSQKAKRDGIDAAAQQGGHRDPKITTSFYSSSLMPDNVLPFWEEPTLAALAKVAQKAS
jgi:hypothetical protein